MEERSESTRYWCHECSRALETFMDSEMIKCSICHGGFVEEIDSARSDHHTRNHHHHHHTGDSLSLLAPILCSNPPRCQESRHIEYDENEDNNDPERGEFGFDSITRRQRRSPTTILQLLQAVWSGMITDSNIANNNNNGDREWGENNNQERDRERFIIINPFNQTIIVQGGGSVGVGGGNPFDSGGLQPNHPIGSIGDYFVGSGLELLPHRLAENDPIGRGSGGRGVEHSAADNQVDVQEEHVTNLQEDENVTNLQEDNQVNVQEEHVAAEDDHVNVQESVGDVGQTASVQHSEGRKKLTPRRKPSERIINKKLAKNVTTKDGVGSSGSKPMVIE